MAAHFLVVHRFVQDSCRWFIWNLDPVSQTALMIPWPRVAKPFPHPFLPLPVGRWSLRSCLQDVSDLVHREGFSLSPPGSISPPLIPKEFMAALWVAQIQVERWRKKGETEREKGGGTQWYTLHLRKMSCFGSSHYRNLCYKLLYSFEYF